MAASFRYGIGTCEERIRCYPPVKVFPGSAGVPPAIELGDYEEWARCPRFQESLPRPESPLDRCGLSTRPSSPPTPHTPRTLEALDGVVRGVEATEVIVEDEVGEGDGHGDIETFDEVHASDWQEEDLSSLENALMNLGLLQACER